MTTAILSTHEQFSEALVDFGKNNPTFPSDLVAVGTHTECRSKELLLEYRCESEDVLRIVIDSPATWEDFEIQLAEFWDEIDFKEKPVDED